MSDLCEALRLFITKTGSRSRLVVGGEIDVATVDALRDHFALLVESGSGDIDVDMAAVTFCDATFLRVLLAARQDLHAGGRHIHVINPSPPTTRLLQLARLDATTLAPSHRVPEHRAQLPTRTCRVPETPIAADGRSQEGADSADRQTHHRRLG